MAMSQGIATTPTKRRIVGGVDGTLAAIPVHSLQESEPISRVFGTLPPRDCLGLLARVALVARVARVPL